MTIIINGADKPATRASLGLTIGTDVLAPNGSAASLTNIPADQITGTIAHSNLGTGGSASTFLRGDGTFVAVGGGAWSVKSSGTFSSTSSFEVTNITKTTIVYFTAINQTQNSPGLRVSTDNGSTYETNYNQYGAESTNSALSNFSFQGTLSSIFLHGTAAPDAGGFLSGWYMLVQPADTNTKTVVLAQCVGEHSGNTGQQMNTMTGVHLTAGAVNAIKLFHPGATSSLTSGSFVVCELN